MADLKTQQTKRALLLRWGIFASPLLLLVVLFGWGMSSPVGSSPDDGFHVASIWCAQGEREGLCETNEHSDERLVPQGIAHMACFAFEPTVDASCQGTIVEDASSQLAPVNHGNWNGATYPPLFFAFFSLFTSQNLAISVIAIRFVNALIATVALTATMIALPRQIRPVLGMSAAIAFIPMGLFLLPSTNPSSWALISAAMVFPTVFSISRTLGRQRIALIALALIGTLIGAGARADAAAYAALAALLAWFLSNRRDLWTIVTVAVIAVAGAAFYLSAGQSEGLNGLSTDPNAPSGGISLLVFNIMQLPSLWLGMFTNLGWLDTTISPLAVFAMVFAAIGVLFAALAGLTWRKGIAMAVAFGALIMLPLYVLNSSHASVGSQVQPRYVLPLFVLLVAVAMVPVPEQGPRFSRVQIGFIAVLLIGAQAVALYDELTRYIAGERILNLDAGAWWWGGSPVSPLTVLGLSSLAFAGLISVLAAQFARDQRSFSASAPIEAADSPQTLSR